MPPAMDEPAASGTGAAGRLVDGPVGPGQCVRPERRVDPGPHGVEINPDRGQRGPVEVGEQARPGPHPGPADDFLLNPVRREAPLTQDRAGRLIGADQGQQQMLTADVAVAEPASVSLGMDHDGAGVIGEVLDIIASRSACGACGGRSAW